jgi:threonine synthase
MSLNVICTECGKQAKPLDWRCSACEGRLEFEALPPFRADSIKQSDNSLWRYEDWLPVKKRITLGEGMTSLVETEVNGVQILVKLEYLNPTGSYKDRGTTTLLNHIAAYDVPEVIDDSSGNAGASIAAFASAAGIKARIFLPAKASPSKKALIKAFGGSLEEIEGPQSAKTEACYEAAKTTTFASHAWSPYFVLGNITAGFEIWEQMLPNMPDAILVPVGHGGIFLGIARGFQLLKEAKLIDRLPRMFAIQSEKIDPLVQAFESGSDTVARVNESGRTVADGIIVNWPVLGKEVLKAIRETGGAAFRVTDEAILQAQTALWRKGFTAEPTSSATVAALPQVQEQIGQDARIVCILTGNGLKNLQA